ncbi:uncharacterized protein PGTG_07762 [Puccinia graminis f. sp. tritici CRL 75-36-700-3]|uniref:Uncharacterized protein n=1 Tax=Puccinia graminis f. sp. tritici (strain CRL 75-36-700-3 / race SCCL) TaxID=418459 RepID=E3KBM8_PUCGT|nr:uncharacterized protein PGTG_07762 [Puccinia graminis f. sp. tritici CRL 75-36-700-3]EFP81513.1 hypothetical protein PGTG_07762 [Puccinia graminis f. sp. tritici CRL 75-36-700-3]
MLPPPIDPTTVIHLAALWNWNRLQRTIERRVYIRAKRVAFICPERWEPWNDDRLPPVRFLEYFRMSRANFAWLCEELRGTLDQDHLRRGAPLTVEAQVAALPLLLIIHYQRLGGVPNLQGSHSAASDA